MHCSWISFLFFQLMFDCLRLYIYIYIYIPIYIRYYIMRVLVISKSLCGYVSNQVQYNIENEIENRVFKWNWKCWDLNPLYNLMPWNCRDLSLYIYIYIYVCFFKKKTKPGHIRIINLFPSCYRFWYKSKTPKKVTGLLQI